MQAARSTAPREVSDAVKTAEKRAAQKTVREETALKAKIAKHKQQFQVEWLVRPLVSHCPGSGTQNLAILHSCLGLSRAGMTGTLCACATFGSATFGCAAAMALCGHHAFSTALCTLSATDEVTGMADGACSGSCHQVEQ